MTRLLVGWDFGKIDSVAIGILLEVVVLSTLALWSLRVLRYDIGILLVTRVVNAGVWLSATCVGVTTVNLHAFSWQRTPEMIVHRSTCCLSVSVYPALGLPIVTLACDVVFSLGLYVAREQHN